MARVTLTLAGLGLALGLAACDGGDHTGGPAAISTADAVLVARCGDGAQLVTYGSEVYLRSAPAANGDTNDVKVGPSADLHQICPQTFLGDQAHARP